jgi:hypothetical protein
MSFVSRIFGTTSQADNAPQQNAPTQVTQSTQVTPVEPAAPVSPMDQFKSLWEPVNTPGVDNTLPANMFAGADPTKMLEAARKVNFASQVPADVLAKITAGGPDAAAAFAAAINDVAQRSYAQSSFASTKIVEAALAKFQEGMDARLPSQVKNFQVRESIRESNPALQHPAAAPIMEALQSQIAVKYPNATVNEIRDMASQYLTQFSSAANPVKSGPAVPASEDWGKFFG